MQGKVDDSDVTNGDVTCFYDVTIWRRIACIYDVTSIYDVIHINDVIINKAWNRAQCSRMVQRISSDKKEVAMLLKRQQPNLSISEIATICAISTTSALKYTKPPVEEEKKKPGRKPKKLDTKIEKKVLRTLRRVKRENTKVTVKTLCGESGMNSYTVKRILTQNGYGVMEDEENGGQKEVVKLEPPKPEPKVQEVEEDSEDMDVM